MGDMSSYLAQQSDLLCYFSFRQSKAEIKLHTTNKN